MKVLIMGCGRAGAKLAALLDCEGHQVTIMDTNANSFSRLDPAFNGTALLGDGTDGDSLRRAGIEEIDAFVAVTEGDNRNVMAAQLAKHLFNVPKVICRLYDPLLGELYQTLGIEILSSTLIFAQLLKDKLLKEEIESSKEV
jgi:trk system potassium uptake protein TrkA